MIIFQYLQTQMFVYALFHNKDRVVVNSRNITEEGGLHSSCLLFPVLERRKLESSVGFEAGLGDRMIPCITVIPAPAHTE
jgi:hypothetical protein